MFRLQQIAMPLTVAFLSSVVVGCVPMAPPTPAAPNYVPKFDYTPQTQAGPGSAKVAFSVVNPQFPATAQSGFGRSRPPVLVKFQDSMGADFQELLNARGFTTRGPFVNYDEMTYPDKKDTDLILDAEIELAFDDLGTESRCNIFAFPASCTYSGTVQVGAQMNLVISESLSHEKMWTKRIELDGQQISWKGTSKTRMVKTPDGFAEPPMPAFSAHFADPGFSNAVGPLLEGYYATIMKKAETYLNPQEMARIKAQSKSIRDRKVY